ncbi:MAG: OmpA family protein [Granulicella sp.]
MLTNSLTCLGRISWMRVAVLAILCCIGVLAGAQEVPAPKVEIFGGYSYLYPNATVNGVLPGGVLPISSCLCAIPRGAGIAATYNFSRWFGVTGDVSGHWGPGKSTPINEVGKSTFYNFSVGPKFTLHTHRFSPFGEVLVGGHWLKPELFSSDTHVGFLAGGGLDLRVSKHIAVRIVQADYVFSNHQFGPSATVPATDIRGVRLQSGIVFMFGGHSNKPAQTASIPAPLPVQNVISPVAVIAQPPTLSCSASPSSMNTGDSSTITAHAVSPQNRPMTYSYSATAGSISGTTSTAILTTAGVAAGTIFVTCNVVDNMGQSALQTPPVTLVPMPVSKPVTQALCTVDFGRDARRPARVNNEGKACLDDIALNLQRSSNARLAVIGNAHSADNHRNKLGAQRAENIKAYLVTDKGIDPTRISIYSGSESQDSASTILIPFGVVFDTKGDTRVDSR